MPGREYTTQSIAGYRFGFNGKERDDENNTQDYGMRIYSPGLGRFFSVDPIASDFPWNSTYAFAENQPIWATDLDGLEKCIQIGQGYKDNCKGAPTKYNFSTYPFSRYREIVSCDMVAKYAKSGFINGLGESFTRVKYFWVVNDDPNKSTQFGGDKENHVPGFYIGETQEKVTKVNSTSSINYNGNTSTGVGFFSQVLRFDKALTALKDDLPIEDKVTLESSLVLEINFFQKVEDGVSSALVKQMEEKISERDVKIEVVVKYNVKIAIDRADKSLDRSGEGYKLSKARNEIPLSEKNNVEMHLIKEEKVEGWVPKGQ